LAAGGLKVLQEGATKAGLIWLEYVARGCCSRMLLEDVAFVLGP
jgi:hypothetical protein